MYIFFSKRKTMEVSSSDVINVAAASFIDYFGEFLTEAKNKLSTVPPASNSHKIMEVYEHFFVLFEGDIKTSEVHRLRIETVKDIEQKKADAVQIIFHYSRMLFSMMIMVNIVKIISFFRDEYKIDTIFPKPWDDLEDMNKLNDMIKDKIMGYLSELDLDFGTISKYMPEYNFKNYIQKMSGLSTKFSMEIKKFWFEQVSGLINVSRDFFATIAAVTTETNSEFFLGISDELAKMKRLSPARQVNSIMEFLASSDDASYTFFGPAYLHREHMIKALGLKNIILLNKYHGLITENLKNYVFRVPDERDYRIRSIILSIKEDGYSFEKMKEINSETKEISSIKILDESSLAKISNIIQELEGKNDGPDFLREIISTDGDSFSLVLTDRDKLVYIPMLVNGKLVFDKKEMPESLFRILTNKTLNFFYDGEDRSIFGIAEARLKQKMK
jgi:hypothetical protein